jgi:hypothetical protein
VTVSGTVDGRDVAADGSKLDGIEAGANVTDTANVTAAGALMDSEVTNLAQVKAFSSADYATAAQGSLADSALQSGDNVSALTNDAGYTTNVGDITGVTAGSGISGGGTSGTVTINHADTSSQASVNNSGATVIQDVTVDTYGHVTGLASKTLTAADVGALSTSGKAADSNLLDGIDSSAFLRSNTADTFTTLSGTQLNIGSQVQLAESSDRADLLQITSSTSSWAGLQIRNSSNEGRWSFMTDGENAGIYNDEDNQWHIYMTEAAGVELRHAANTKLATTSSGVSLSGQIDMNNNDIVGVDQIIHEGDTDTYIQFHAADQWRVVTGGAERLEVNNSQVTSTEPIYAPSFHGNGSALTGISVTPSTAQVLSATAGLSVGSVGSYAFLRKTSSGTAATPGSTFSGASMRYTDSERYSGTVVGSGTWRCLAHQAFWDRGTVWVRIS